MRAVIRRTVLWCVDLGWLACAHPAALPLPLLSRTSAPAPGAPPALPSAPTLGSAELFHMFSHSSYSCGCAAAGLSWSGLCLTWGQLLVSSHRGHHCSPPATRALPRKPNVHVRTAEGQSVTFPPGSTAVEHSLCRASQNHRSLEGAQGCAGFGAPRTSLSVLGTAVERGRLSAGRRCLAQPQPVGLPGCVGSPEKLRWCKY